VPVDDEITDVALDAAHDRLFALIPYANQVVVIDTSTNTVRKRVTLTGDANRMVLDVQRAKLYILTEHPTSLVTISTLTSTVQRKAKAPTGATLMELNPSTGMLYMDSWVSNRGSIIAVDPRSARILWRVKGIDDAAAIVPNSTGRLLYVPLADDEHPGSLLVVNAPTRKESASITVGMWPGLPVLDEARARLYLATANERFVTVIDTVTNTVIGRIPTGGDPSTPTLDGSGARLFVSSYARSGGSVLMIDPQSNAVVARVAVGESPSSPVVDAAGTRLYVSSWVGSTVSVINVGG
jgi:YVTN family beta-propeller protein